MKGGGNLIIGAAFYIDGGEKKKASVRDSYKADPEKKKASVRDSYNADIESWPAIADMNSVIRVIKLLNMESMGNFYQSRSLVPKTCSKVYKPKYDTGTNNTLFVYLLFCKNLPPSISKRGFVLLHAFNGWHTFDHYFPFPILPRGRCIEDYKVDSEAKAIYVQIAYLPHVHVYF